MSNKGISSIELGFRFNKYAFWAISPINFVRVFLMKKNLWLPRFVLRIEVLK